MVMVKWPYGFIMKPAFINKFYERNGTMTYYNTITVV